MTTIQRDLTPFEVDRLEHLRVTFSGMPDAAQIIAEQEQEYRSAPVPPDCPPWCGQPAGHTYDSTASDGTFDARFHELAMGHDVSVCQEEQRTPDGQVELLPPYATTYTDNRNMDAAATSYLADAVSRAADKLREIGGAV